MEIEGKRTRDHVSRGREWNGAKANWLVDAGLFAGFVLAMLLDVTGVAPGFHRKG